MNQILLVALIAIAAIIAIAIVGALARGIGKRRLHSLPDEAKDRYASSWHAIEARFIEDPRAAVRDADKTAVMVFSERGANVGDETHMPNDLQRARAATRGDGGTTDTEGLRRAMTQYKAIFDDAVGSSRLAGERGRREVAS